MIRLPFTIVELSAMALGRCARSSTISTTNDWRAGVSNALMIPWTTCSTRMYATVIDAGERQHGERERLQHREHLRDDQDAMPVPAVDEHAGERREHERRDLAAEADDAEQQRRAGEPIDQPARGNARDPGADQRDALSAEEEAVVSGAERAEQVGHLCCGRGR